MLTMIYGMLINHQATIIVVQWDVIKVFFMVKMAAFSYQSTILIVTPLYRSWMSMPIHVTKGVAGLCSRYF